MTAIAVPCPPPGVDRVHARLVRDTSHNGPPLSTFIAAVCQDSLRAAVESGGEAVAVPLEPEVPLPGWDNVYETVVSLGTAVAGGEKELPVAEPIPHESDWPSQTLATARDRSAAASVAILVPQSPLVQRRHVDAAAMQLRSHDLVLGPSTGSAWYFLGTDRDLEPTVPSDGSDIHGIASRAIEAGRSLSTIEFLPGYRTGEEFRTLIDLLDIAGWADEAAAPHSRQWLEAAGRIAR